MSDIVSELATKSGLSTEQAQKALGAVLAFVKQSLPEDKFSQVSAAVPNADQMMAAADLQEKPSGGIIESIAGAASKLFGGGGASALVSKLASLGISPEQMQAFLPRVLEFLKGKVPDSTTNQLAELLPMPQEANA